MDNNNLSWSVLLLTANHQQLPLNISIKHDIQKEFNDLRCFVVTHFDPGDEKEVSYLYAQCGGLDALPTEGIAQSIREEFDLEPALLYKSDLRYARKNTDEADLLKETYLTLVEARKLIENNNVQLIFMYGGGTLFTNCFFELSSRYDNVKCFRMHPIQYLNTVPNTLRYFFTDNNYQRLPERREGSFEPVRLDKCREHAKTYIEAVKTRRFIPDSEARMIARRGMFTPRFGQMLKASLLWIAVTILKRRNPQIKEQIIAYFRKLYLDFTRRKYRFPGDYFIYVLHHPYDSQLLLRGRCFVDQIALCRILATNMPSGCYLLVKEHPVQPGMLPISDIRRLKSLYNNLTYVDYTVKFNEIVSKARGIITINSTAGLEAMIHGIPVIVLGETFYRGQPFVYNVEYLKELTGILKEVLVRPKVATEEEIVELLARLIYETEPDPDINGDDTHQFISAGVIKRIKEFKRCQAT